ncbi:MAG: hypothetical protein M3327_13095 [Actinomycetota bacterium]|nr:hypothetical protein [Actinomycetota bacterium]
MAIFRRLFGKGEESRTETRGISKEEALAGYVVREHRLGRSIDEILEDPYLRNRTTEEQRLRLLERPEVIRAIGEDTAAMARERARGA